MKIEKVNDFWVPSNDIHINDWKNGQPFTQNKCLNKFLEWCRAQDKKFKKVIDVGAWCGTWTKALAPYCKKIIAFEPDKLHYKCLEKNTFNLSNVELFQYGIGETNKRISMSEDNFTQAKRLMEKEGNIEVKTIDHFEFGDIDLLKIDVEGYEMKVLEGAKKSLPSIKYIMIELNNNTKKYGSNNNEVEKFLKDNNFNILLDHWPDKVFYQI
jgi:FkbM family methyltransferase